MFYHSDIQHKRLIAAHQDANRTIRREFDSHAKQFA